MGLPRKRRFGVVSHLPAGVVLEGSHDCIWGKTSPRDVASVRESKGAIDG